MERPAIDPPTTSAALRRWLLDDARRLPSTGPLVEGLATTLVALGLPIDRVNFSVITLHPEMVGLAFQWRPGEPLRELNLPHGELSLPRYLNSPLPLVQATRAAVRLRLAPGPAGEPADLRFAICEELAASGHTDYVALPLELGPDTVAILSLASRAEGGLTEPELAVLHEMLPIVSLLVDAHESRRLATTLLATWLGPRSAERVLRGRVQRGDVETIRCALWYADLRGFTAATARMTPVQTIEHVDAAFEVMVEQVHARGGEVLKFVGDAMLAIFPVDDAHPPDAACRDALDAAWAVQAGLATVTHARTAASLPPIEARVGLHIGEVQYGNVGGVGRLDFTVIGHAVNVVARIEGLCDPLGHSVLASDAFADQLPLEWVDRGQHAVKGVPEPVGVRTTTRPARVDPPAHRAAGHEPPAQPYRTANPPSTSTTIPLR
jgi:adenylate cyclase